MLALIYKYTGSGVSRSVVRAQLVTDVEIDAIPDDQEAFAREYGGDFIEILQDALAAR
jgi:hypothetical protein